VKKNCVERKNTLTPLSSLNPLLLNPRIEIEFGGLGVSEAVVTVFALLVLQLNLVELLIVVSGDADDAVAAAAE
jgi:hypothetical protein